MVSFLVDFLRFEAARSSKVAIFGLWIGPNTTLGWRELLRRVAKKKRKKSNKLAWFFLHAYPLFEKNCFESKYMSFFSSSSCTNENWCGFYREHIPSSLQPFRRLVLTHALIVHPKEKLFLARDKLPDIIWAGRRLFQFVENLPLCSLMGRLLWCDRSQFRHIYFHEPITVLIFLYIGQEPMVSAVRFPVFIWSFSF